MESKHSEKKKNHYAGIILMLSDGVLHQKHRVLSLTRCMALSEQSLDSCDCSLSFVIGMGVNWRGCDMFRSSSLRKLKKLCQTKAHCLTSLVSRLPTIQILIAYSICSETGWWEGLGMSQLSDFTISEEQVCNDRF